MTQFTIVIEHHPDGYVAYPLGLNGAVVGQGNIYDEALADVTSAIRFHIETFGLAELELDASWVNSSFTEAIEVNVGHEYLM